MNILHHILISIYSFMWNVDRYLENKEINTIIGPCNYVEYIQLCGMSDCYYQYRPKRSDVISNIKCNYDMFYGFTYGIDGVNIVDINIDKLTLPLFANQYDIHTILIKIPKYATDDICVSFDIYYLPDHIVPNLLLNKVCNDVGLIFYEGFLIKFNYVE